MILIHAYKWFHHENVGNYYSSSESQFHDFAMYYGLPELSVKAAAWNLMRTGECADSSGQAGVIGTIGTVIGIVIDKAVDPYLLISHHPPA